MDSKQKSIKNSAKSNKKNTINNIRKQHKSNEDIYFIALKLIYENFHIKYTPYLINFFFSNISKIKTISKNLLYSDSIFSFEKRNIDKSKLKPDNKLAYYEKPFSVSRIQELSRIIKNIDDNLFKESLKEFTSFPGINNLNLKKIFSGSKKKYYPLFKQFYKDHLNNYYPQQLTIAPSYDCNLSCSYCFSKYLKKRYSVEMSFEKFKQILDSVSNFIDLKRVNFFGGEPTVFPQILKFINEICKRNLTFYFATNGLANYNLFKKITGYKNLESITFHIEKDSYYKKEQLKLLIKNIQIAVKNKVKIIIRYNLEDPTYNEWDFLKKYITIIPDFEFSFSVIFPSLAGNNKNITIQELKKFNSKIISLVFYLIQNTQNQDQIIFAKPFPLCFFNEHELNIILRFCKLKNVCEIDKNDGLNNVCVNPDGSFFPCMALNIDKYHFNSISDYIKVKNEYQLMIKKFINTPLLPECKECHLYNMGVCQAACYSYI